MNYFIMVNNPQGEGIHPLLDEDDNLELFETLDEAIARAKANKFMKHFGYEVYERGTGEHTG